MCNNDYELLETFQKDNETWSYLRHKKTGLEIAYHQCESEETGFSFCFRTPVEDPYLGTTHVLEHCVLQASKKYDVSFLQLLPLSVYTDFNAETTNLSTRYFFYSLLEKECFKLIPILAEYLFFPKLSEECFMQECMRVEFDSTGDGRKKEIAGVIYNEMKPIPPEESLYGGVYYKLHELTNNKLKEYHKKYYRPDNCLFVFNGKSTIEEVLKNVNKIIAVFEDNNFIQETKPRSNLTIQEFLKTVPFVAAPEKIEDPELAHWLNDEKEDICDQIEGYWLDGVSPLIQFCLEDKYAYSEVCWWKKNHPEVEEPPIPPKLTIPKIKASYLSHFTPEEYKEKLKSLHEWQARDVREEALRILEPLAVSLIDIKLPDFEKNLELLKDRHKHRIEFRNKHYHGADTFIYKASCSIEFCPSEEFTRAFYAEYALSIFLKPYLFQKFRQLGKLYDINSVYTENCTFNIFTISNFKPEQTLKVMIEAIKAVADYSFTETDLLVIKSQLYSKIISQKSGYYNFSEVIFTVTPEELHQASVRFKEKLEKRKL